MTYTHLIFLNNLSMGLHQQILTKYYCKIIHLEVSRMPLSIENFDSYMAKYSTIIINLMQFRINFWLVYQLIFRIIILMYFSLMQVDQAKCKLLLFNYKSLELMMLQPLSVLLLQNDRYMIIMKILFNLI